MPREFQWRVPVWQADLDPAGEVRCSALVRLLQETATRASADAGFDTAYYTRTRTMWLVRRTAFTLVAPARADGDLEVRTRITDFRRVRSQREYEILAGIRVVATAWTDWVFVDTDTQRPRRIPTDMEAAFAPEGAPALPRAAFPHAEPPSDAHESERRVEAHELDALDHVNNAHYVDYVEQAALDAAAAAGWPPSRQHECGGRLRVTTHDLEYLEPALCGDTLRVSTWPVAVTGDLLERHTLVLRAASGGVLLQARSRYAWIDRATGEPASLPGELATALG